jgi:hypothetical protein
MDVRWPGVLVLQMHAERDIMQPISGVAIVKSTRAGR